MLSLITDRTAADVTYVEQLAAIGWSAMSVAQKTAYLAGLKGSYTYVDYNRVAAAMHYLADLLTGHGYPVTVSSKTDWVVGDEPATADRATYLADLNALKACFFGTETLPTVMDHLTHTEANEIEQLLIDIEVYVVGMEELFRKCGTFSLGSDYFTQYIRRG